MINASAGDGRNDGGRQRERHAQRQQRDVEDDREKHTQGQYDVEADREKHAQGQHDVEADRGRHSQRQQRDVEADREKHAKRQKHDVSNIMSSINRLHYSCIIVFLRLFKLCLLRR